MRIHPLAKIRRLKHLRKRGYSINELVNALSIPKTTVWHHIHNITIPSKYALLLKAKRGGSAKRTQRNWILAKEKAKQLLISPDREFLIALAMLYWGESSKKTCDFINSNGKIIKLYLTILRRIFKIPEETIKPTLRIFSGMNETDCLNYWSKTTKIPKRKFIIRLNDGGTRGKTKYGMCRISITKGKGSDTLKLIYSLIDQIFEEMVNKYPS